MPVSFANVNPSAMELTSCRVKLGGVDLGGTIGNVKVTMAFKKADIKADQFGDTVLDKRVSGVEYKVETVLSQINDPAIWKAAFPNLLKVGTGPYAMYGISKIGESDLSLAQTLNLHPLSLSDSDLSGDFNFLKVTAESVSEVTFGPTEQQGLKVVFNVFPDMSAVPAKFMIHGDPAIGLVAATFDAPTYLGTGNGLMSGVSVFGTTVTETITAKCVGVPALNKSNWIVEGTLSGVIGYAEITSGSVNFSSNKIAFTITDGSTDFIIGDTFTVGTHASNYV